MRFGLAPALAMLLLTACGRQPDSASPRAEGFALSLEVEAPGAQVMRVDLPAAALVAIKREDKGDIRVLDAHGRPLSMAFVEPDAAQTGRVHLDAIPFGGESGGDRRAPVSIRVDQGGNSVQIQAEGSKAQSPEHSVLFDSRVIRDSVVAIALEAALPKQRPVTVWISAGQDLKSWEPLAEQLLFRPNDGPGLLGGSRISLPASQLHRRYLRVSWQDKELAITGATLHGHGRPFPQRGQC